MESDWEMLVLVLLSRRGQNETDPGKFFDYFRTSQNISRFLLKLSSQMARANRFETQVDVTR